MASQEAAGSATGMVSKVDFGDRLYKVYDAANTVPEGGDALLVDRVLSHLARRTHVVDVGSGTGIWSVRVAAATTVQVVGVEPSQEMLSVALSRREACNVQFVRGCAEAVP